MIESDDNLFSPEESERRMTEAMRRMSRQPRTMNMTTGQNLKNADLNEGCNSAPSVSGRTTKEKSQRGYGK